MSRYQASIKSLLIAALILFGDLVGGLETQADQTDTIVEQKQKDYETAMKSGGEKLKAGDYAGATTQADVALANKPNDKPAQQMKQDAKRQQDAVVLAAQTAVQKRKDYEAAVRAGRAAFSRKDYFLALTNIEEALLFKPIDATAIILREDIRAQISADKNVTDQTEKYQTAMLKVRGAFDRRDFNNALSWIDVALKIRPADPGATELKRRSVLEIKAKNGGEQFDRLDEQLEVLLVTFNIVDSKKARTQKAREAKILPSAIEKDYYLKLVTELKKQFNAAGLLDEDRAKKLQQLERTIPNW